MIATSRWSQLPTQTCSHCQSVLDILNNLAYVTLSLVDRILSKRKQQHLFNVLHLYCQTVKSRLTWLSRNKEDVWWWWWGDFFFFFFTIVFFSPAWMKIPHRHVRGITVSVLGFTSQPAACTARGRRCPTRPGSRSRPPALPARTSSWSPGSWTLRGRPRSGWWGGSRSRTGGQAARRPATRTYADLGVGERGLYWVFNQLTRKHEHTSSPSLFWEGVGTGWTGTGDCWAFCLTGVLGGSGAHIVRQHCARGHVVAPHVDHQEVVPLPKRARENLNQCFLLLKKKKKCNKINALIKHLEVALVLQHSMWNRSITGCLQATYCRSALMSSGSDQQR